MPRLLPHNDYLAIKAHTRTLVTLCGGPKRAAQISRGHASHISEAMAAHDEVRFLAVDQIADLEAECGDPVITRHLADMHGLDLVSRDASPKPENIHHRFAQIIAESSDVQRAIAEALADGTITEEEKPAIVREAHQAIQQLQALIDEMKPRAARIVHSAT